MNTNPRKEYLSPECDSVQLFAKGAVVCASGGDQVYTFYLCEKGKAYTVESSASGATVAATLKMGLPTDMVLLHIPGNEVTVEDYTFGCSLIRPVSEM